MTAGYVNRTNEQRDLQPVAILSIDPVSRLAKAMTRIGTEIEIDCRYPVGSTYVIPDIGDQWYVDRYDMAWKLNSRIPFNDNNILIESVPGQMVMGGTGPVVLNGSHVDIHSDTQINGSLGVGEVMLQEIDGVLQQSSDGGETWEGVGSGGGSGPGGPVAITDVTGLTAALGNKVDKNTAIAPGTRTKITYDSKGLVTAGGDAAIADITGLTLALSNKSPTTHVHSDMPLNAENLYNQVPTDILAQIPVANIGTYTTNMVTDPEFMDPASFQGLSVWFHDPGAGYNGKGAARTIADGTSKELLGNWMPCSQGQTMPVSAKASWNSLVGSGSPIGLGVTGYTADGSAIDQVTLASHNTTPPTTAYIDLAGTYPVPANVVWVRVRLIVTPAATSGTVRFSSIAATKTGLLPQTLVVGTTGTTLADDLTTIRNRLTALGG